MVLFRYEHSGPSSYLLAAALSLVLLSSSSVDAVKLHDGAAVYDSKDVTRAEADACLAHTDSTKAKAVMDSRWGECDFSEEWEQGQSFVYMDKCKFPADFAYTGSPVVSWRDAVSTACAGGETAMCTQVQAAVVSTMTTCDSTCEELKNTCNADTNCKSMDYWVGPICFPKKVVKEDTCPMIKPREGFAVAKTATEKFDDACKRVAGGDDHCVADMQALTYQLEFEQNKQKNPSLTMAELETTSDRTSCIYKGTTMTITSMCADKATWKALLGFIQMGFKYDLCKVVKVNLFEKYGIDMDTWGLPQIIIGILRPVISVFLQISEIAKGDMKFSEFSFMQNHLDLEAEQRGKDATVANKMLEDMGMAKSLGSAVELSREILMSGQ